MMLYVHSDVQIYLPHLVYIIVYNYANAAFVKSVPKNHLHRVRNGGSTKKELK